MTRFLAALRRLVRKRPHVDRDADPGDMGGGW